MKKNTTATDQKETAMLTAIPDSTFTYSVKKSRKVGDNIDTAEVTISVPLGELETAEPHFAQAKQYADKLAEEFPIQESVQVTGVNLWYNTALASVASDVNLASLLVRFSANAKSNLASDVVIQFSKKHLGETIGQVVKNDESFLEWVVKERQKSLTTGTPAGPELRLVAAAYEAYKSIVESK